MNIEILYVGTIKDMPEALYQQLMATKPKQDKCKVEGCDRKPCGRGMCHKHYNRWHALQRKQKPS